MDMWLKVIGMCAQSLLMILGSTDNIIQEIYVIIEEKRTSALFQ